MTVSATCRRATMPRSRTASSSGVGRQSPAARGIATCRSHVTLTVILARLLVLRSFPRFWRKREAARNAYTTHHHKALLISKPVENVRAIWHDMRGGTHTRIVSNIEKIFFSRSFSHVDLFSAYNSAQ